MFVEMNANAVMLRWGLKIRMAYSQKKKKEEKKNKRAVKKLHPCCNFSIKKKKILEGFSSDENFHVPSLIFHGQISLGNVNL